MIDPRPCFSTFGVSGVARVLHHLRVLGAVGAALLALTLSRSASAAVTTPFPGVVLVDDGDRSLAIADLCAPGVSVRATAYAERKATPEQWANNAAVNADVAVNADFFDFPGWTYVVGRARGAGQDWPAGQQLREVRSYWQFGPGIAGSVEPANVAPAAGVTEIVGGHNTIIRGGKSLAPSFDGDSVILGTYRRTGIGLDATHAHLYLFASNTALSGTGMAAAMIQLAAEGNAPAIDVATNEDGGGSSQMYVRGKSQIIDSGRQVNNHLGILAKGGGAAPMCPNAAPRGAFDGVDCTHVFGWAQDPSTPTAAIAAHLYFNGAAGAVGATGISVPADVGRGDLVAAVGSPNHGFDAPTPFGLFDGKEHPIFAYAIDSQGGANTQLGTHSVTCAAAAPPSVRRHVVSPDSFTAWKFSGFQDLLPLDEATVTAFAPASDVDLAPVLFVSDDKTKTEVWLQDSVTKRHVVSVASAASWRFDLSKLATKPADVVNAMPTGPALRTRPLLARTADGAVWLLDDRSVVPGLPPDDDAGAGPGGGGGGIAAGDGGSTPGNGDTATDDSSGCSTARSIGSSRAGATVLGGLLVGGFVLVARRRKR